MKNELMIFENGEIRCLEIDEVVWFVGKDITNKLGYKNSSEALSMYVDDEDKILLSSETQSNLSIEFDYKEIGQRGGYIISEDGVIDLIYNSKLPKAKEFKKKVREIVKEVQATGRYDTVEQQLKLIEDPKEKEFKLSIYTLEKAIKLNPNDLLTTLAYNNAKQELNTYLSNKKIDEVKTKVTELEEDFNKATKQLKKTTVLREGDMSAEAISRKLNIFSVNDLPHNRFADLLAKNLGFYIHPEGQSGYSDDYISINLESKFGKTTAVIKYSTLALQKMNDYIEENGLKFEEPPIRYVRGTKKGQFNYAYSKYYKQEN
jgi:prophage antirepressor-like protein